MGMATADAQPLRSSLLGDPEIRELMPEFVADLPAKVSQLAAILERADVETLRRHAHQLKGVGGTFGFMALTDAAEKLELAIAEGRNIDEVAVLGLRLMDLIRTIDGYDAANESLTGGVRKAA